MPQTRKKDPKTEKAAKELSEKLLKVLESQQRLEDQSAYPLTIERLQQLTDPEASMELIQKATRKAPFSTRSIMAKGPGSRDFTQFRDNPVALKQDLERLANSFILLEFALKMCRTPKIHAFSPSEIENKLSRHLKHPFRQGIEARMQANDLPPSVGWIMIRTAKLFLVEDLQPGVPSQITPTPREASSEDFATRFEAAFERLNRASGGENFVSLVDLRKALPEFDRQAFDQGLYQLRVEGHFDLSAAEGRFGIDPEERAAGIEEAGALLLFVSRI